MCRKLICLVSFIFVLGLVLTSVADAADPGLLGWWKFDNEGTGTVLDYSGNGRDGTLMGNAQFVPGVFNQAVALSGSGDYVTIAGYAGVLGSNAFSITAWIKTNENGVIVAWGNNVGRERVEFRVNEYRLRVEHGSGNRQGDTFVSDNEWHHVALTVTENATISYPDLIFYLDGEDDTISGTSANAFDIVANYDVKIGRSYAWNNRWFIGLIDDVRIYDRVLTQAEIQVLAVLPAAYNPSPADGAVHPQTWVSLNWSPGAYATSHDVYFGDNLHDVAAGTGDASQGNQTETFLFAGIFGYSYPGGLEKGTTYYWRVDAVDDLHPDSPWKGDLWSFTVPPATAINPDPPDEARFVDRDVILSWTAGLDARLHTVYFDEDFEVVNNAAGDMPQGPATYTPGTLAFDKVYYWRVDEFEGPATHKGDVWSFRTKPFIPIYDPNLICWWKFEDEGGGTAIDYSGYGHHGTLRGDPQWVAGYDGDALELDGNDWVNMDGYKGVIGSHAFSITAWIKTSGGPFNNGDIVGWGQATNGRRVRFRVNGNRLRCENGGSDRNVQGDTNVTDDEWHHVAVIVLENATISYPDLIFYLDGEDDTISTTDAEAFNLAANLDVKMGQAYDLTRLYL